MINAISKTFNSRPLMLWIIIFPAFISITTKETPLQYAINVLFYFVIFVIIESIILKFSKNNSEEN